MGDGINSAGILPNAPRGGHGSSRLNHLPTNLRAGRFRPGPPLIFAVAALWLNHNFGRDQGTRAADIKQRTAHGDHAGNERDIFSDVVLGENCC